MPVVDFNCLINLQRDVSRIRNICILAHVDHGKTTLADSLIASNGIISQRMAGKLRYMDNREDEQERGITMKSSSISLFYNGGLRKEDFLINLIDSPGHVDFSSEVSTAVRLCDGAVIVVDVIEGLCPQTRACLQQAYTEQLKPVLVFNKIDRLILEKQMEPLDAYLHIGQLLEQVNAALGSIFATDILSKENFTQTDTYESVLESVDDSKLYFCPQNGNVIFCSAIDGWGFSIANFADMYAARLDINSSALEKVLWGDFYYNPKKKYALPSAQEKAKKPMFVQFIFENIWSLYDTIVIRRDKEKLPFIAEKLGIKLSIRDMRLGDAKTQLKAVLSQWLPVDRAVLDMVVRHVPSPNEINEDRARWLLYPNNVELDTFPIETLALKDSFVKCDSHSDIMIAFVSKMIPIHISQLPKNKPKRLSEQELHDRRDEVKKRIMQRKLLAERNTELNVITSGIEKLSTENGRLENVVESREEKTEFEFVAFARIFSGTLKRGNKLFALSPKHDPRNGALLNTSSPYVSEVTIGDLYIFMGTEVQQLDEVAAGNIVGIGGLGDIVIKNATISNSLFCPSFTEMNIMATPIFRVAIEPVNPSEMPKLVKGLKLLNQADACVQISFEATGEHVITTLGEVHVEKCVRDLEERYAKVKINVSKPIVSFRETIVHEATTDMVNEAIVKSAAEKAITKKIVTLQTANNLQTIKMIALPLPQAIVDLLEKHSTLFKELVNVLKPQNLSEKSATQLKKIKKTLTRLLDDFDCKGITNIPTVDLINRIWSVGPRSNGTNILINLTDYKHASFWNSFNYNETEPTQNEIADIRKDYNSSFINGFQSSALAGPLCEEPMQGVCFAVLEWSISDEENSNTKVCSPFSGVVMSSAKEICRQAFQVQPQRLVSPMYKCTIVVNAEVLGKMYAVIGKRHGKILSGDLTQGSGNFSVTAVLPVIESFNFAQEIRKETSGLACPQLMFSHWEIIDIDPFWVPSTEEEYMHFGEKADSLNPAKAYMDSVRRRKGLYIDEKLIEHAEKQRTLSKKK